MLRSGWRLPDRGDVMSRWKKLRRFLAQRRREQERRARMRRMVPATA